MRIAGEDICIYDSLYRGEIETILGQAISNIVIPEIKQKGFLIFRVQRVTLQKKTFCGYLSLANLTALCFGLDPETLLFDEHEIREHYLKITFESEPLTMFPYYSKRKSSIKNNLIKFKLSV